MTATWRIVLCLFLLGSATIGVAQSTRPIATLVAAPAIRMAADVDSNSPAVWLNTDGEWVLRVMTSSAGQAVLTEGRSHATMRTVGGVAWLSHPGHGVWLESIIVDHRGVWYGFYHNEVPAALCGRVDRMMPRIGAARSSDGGATWEDLGIILEAPPGQEACGTRNRYFVGGVGDVSAMLDRDSRYLYVFFSQYSRSAAGQGVGVARMPWAWRDRPKGRLDVWNAGVWLPSARTLATTEDGQRTSSWTYPAGTPLRPVTRAWHDSDNQVDAFWGASVHWNTHLNQYVMLLNRAKDENWGQEGIYVAYAPTLNDPGAWSVPVQLLAGGSWYPQILGIETGSGTDKVAGARARFFFGGTSNYFIDFGLR